MDNKKDYTNYKIILIVVIAVAIYVILTNKSSSEYYVPDTNCANAIQAYNKFESQNDSTQDDQTKNQILKNLARSCPANFKLGQYANVPSQQLIGGTQYGNRSPHFFPGPSWDKSVTGSHRTPFGLYEYNQQQ